MFVISFATPRYRPEIAILQRDLDQFKIPYEIEYPPEFASWQRACLAKPEFIRRMLLKHKRPIVWMDADIEVRSYPQLFDDMEASGPSKMPDIAATWFNDKMFNGAVVFYNDTEKTHELLNLWEHLNEIKPNNACGDQENEEDAIEAVAGLRFFKLPQSYCMLDICNDMSNPIMWSRQASRIYKGALCSR